MDGMSKHTEDKSMLAARMHGQQDLRIERIPIADLASQHVRIRVAYTGICGTDIHELAHPHTTCAAATPHPLTGHALPTILGHEFSGTVVERHPDCTTDLKVGARVCIDTVLSCWKCDNCLAGFRYLCKAGPGFIGFNLPGALATFVNVPEKNCQVVPDAVPLHLAAMAEPMSVAWHAVRRANLRPNDVVLVLGSGPIGAMVTVVLKARGVKTVIVSEPSSNRATVAKQCGASIVFDPTKVNLVEECQRLTNGAGVDVAFDCAGVQSTLEAALKASKGQARIVVVAMFSKPAQLDMFSFVLGEKEMVGSVCFTKQDMEEVLSALQDGSLKCEDLVTGKIRLEDVQKEGFDALAKDPHHLKILIDLTQES